MADLLSTFANAYPYDPNSVWRGAQGVQNVMSNALDYQQKREALEAQRGLKALYAQNPNPSYEDIARIDPAFAMQQNKANFEMQKELLGMKETQGKINKQQQEEVQFFANAVGPVVEQYLMNTGGEGNPQQQAALKQQIGAGLRDIEQKTGMRPTNADALLNLSPSEMLNRLMLNGYQSPALKGQMENQMAVQREGMIRGLPPAMTPQQAYGGVEMGPYGPRRVPGLGGYNMTPGPQYGVTPFNPNAGQMQQGPVPRGMQQAPIGAEDLAVLKQNRAQMQPGPERDALDRMIGEVETGRIAQPSADGFVTPQQEMQMRIGEKAAEAGATATAKAEAEKGFATKEQLATLKALEEKDIERLIDKSISSLPEQGLKEYAMSKGLGKPTEAYSATKELRVAAAQMRDMAKGIVGAGPISEGEQEIISKALGSIESAEDPESRKIAYRAFLQLAKRKMQEFARSSQQAPRYDDTQLIDMVSSGQMTKEQAMEIRKRRMAGGQ